MLGTSFILTPCKVTSLGTYTRRPLQTCRVSRRVNVSVTSTRMSLLPFIPNWLLLGAWAFGAYRFYLGFNRTSYQSSFKLPLSLAWPILFIFNSSYRKNFTKSIKGSNDDY